VGCRSMRVANCLRNFRPAFLLYHQIQRSGDFSEHGSEDSASRASRTCVERFIYLWVTFYAWAAQVVPAESQNHIDRYLIRCVAGSERFRRRFDSLMETNRQFRCSVESLCRIGPVTKVLWLRNRATCSTVVRIMTAPETGSSSNLPSPYCGRSGI
jgi:hypothetical protein